MFYSSLVLTGSEILTRLDPSELLRMKIDELHALLVNADPQGFIPAKSNKKTGQEKAYLLPTVQADLRSFLAVAAASTAQAPSLIPISFPPVICEGKKISNLQLERSLEHFLSILTRYFRMRQMPQQMLK
jgi:hypothetical protein